jgi:putative transcriptional regulator
MTRSKLKEGLERLGPVRAAHPEDSALSGGPAEIVIRPLDHRRSVKMIDATRALVACGTGMLYAKRSLETMLTAGLVAIKVPRVDNLAVLAKKLRDAGVHVQKQANYLVDIRALREALQLSREQFAIRYNLSVESVAKWERHTRPPDRAALNYLRAIESDPEGTAKSQLEDVLDETSSK